MLVTDEPYLFRTKAEFKRVLLAKVLDGPDAHGLVKTCSYEEDAFFKELDA